MKFYLIFFIVLNFLISSGCALQKSLVAKEPAKSKNSLDSQLQNLTDQIVLSLSQKQKTKIAVIEFSDLQGKVSEFGKYLAEELITRLYLTNEFEVIERQLLNKVLQEHKLNLSGLIDVSSAQELGRLLGVDAIASGSVTDLGSGVKVNARLISTETGKIFSVASVTIDKDDVVRKLMGESGILAANTSEPIKVDSISPGDVPLNIFVQKNGFSFRLIKCEMFNRNITCSLIIVNESEDDKNLRIWLPDTKIFDQAGNEYAVSVVKLANSSTKKGWSRLDKLIVPGIPTPAEFVFENVSSSVNHISLLTSSVQNRADTIKFRDISVEKQY